MNSKFNFGIKCNDDNIGNYKKCDKKCNDDINGNLKKIKLRRLNGILNINKEELLNLIISNKNTDKIFSEIDDKLIYMIKSRYNKFTVLQSKWIFEKVKYISRRNPEYKYLKGINDINFE